MLSMHSRSGSIKSTAISNTLWSSVQVERELSLRMLSFSMFPWHRMEIALSSSLCSDGNALKNAFVFFRTDITSCTPVNGMPLARWTLSAQVEVGVITAMGYFSFSWAAMTFILVPSIPDPVCACPLQCSILKPHPFINWDSNLSATATSSPSNERNSMNSSLRLLAWSTKRRNTGRCSPSGNSTNSPVTMEKKRHSRTCWRISSRTHFSQTSRSCLCWTAEQYSSLTAAFSNLLWRNSSPALMRFSISAWKLPVVKIRSSSECVSSSLALQLNGKFCLPIKTMTSKEDLRNSLRSFCSGVSWGISSVFSLSSGASQSFFESSCSIEASTKETETNIQSYNLNRLSKKSVN